MELGDGEGDLPEGNRSTGAFSDGHNLTNTEATIIKTTCTYSIVVDDRITDASHVCILQSVSPVHHLSDCQGSRGEEASSPFQRPLLYMSQTEPHQPELSLVFTLY